MRAAAGARTAATDGGTGRITQDAALPAARVGHRQWQRVHERDRSGLLQAGGDRVHALPSLSQERPGLGGAEEWRGRAPHDRLSPLRGPGSRGVVGAIVFRDAAVREFLSTFVQLAAKTRDGAQVRKRYHPPATPCERLLADPRTIEEVQRRVKELRATLDPVRLLQQIRAAQQQLVAIADRPDLGEAAKPTSPTLEQFLLGLRTAWKEGEVRPTSVAKPKPKRCG